MLVPSSKVTRLGAAIFAFLAAGTFKTIEEAQARICSPHNVYEPEKAAQGVYEDLYAHYRKLYFAFGVPATGEFGQVLPALIQQAKAVNESRNLRTP